MLGTLISDIINEGNSFVNSSFDAGLGDNIAEFLRDDILPIVESIGNLVFAAVTVILGAKYIWSGVEGKASVMDTLPAFVAAVLLFYLAVPLTSLVVGAGGDIGNSSNYTTLAGKIIGTINDIVRYASFAGILVIGLKYMFESADGRAKLKERLVPLTLGIILVFCATSVVDFIYNVGSEIL